MTLEALEVSTELPVAPEALYRAWLDGAEHGAFTGADATAEAGVGGRFTAWDGYIEGENLELEPGRRVVQSWRTSEFPEDAPDSRLELRFDATKTGTRLTIAHTGIPAGQGKRYENGWHEHYFEPMRRHFAGR